MDLLEKLIDLGDLGIQLPALPQAELDVGPEPLPLPRRLRGTQPGHGCDGVQAVQQGVDVECGGPELLEPELDMVVNDESALLGVVEHRAYVVLGVPELLGLLLDVQQAGPPGPELVENRAADLLRDADCRGELLEQIHGATRLRRAKKGD